MNLDMEKDKNFNKEIVISIFCLLASLLVFWSYTTISENNEREKEVSCANPLFSELISEMVKENNPEYSNYKFNADGSFSVNPPDLERGIVDCGTLVRVTDNKGKEIKRFSILYIAIESEDKKSWIAQYSDGFNIMGTDLNRNAN